MSDFNVYRSSQPSRDMCPTSTTTLFEWNLKIIMVILISVHFLTKTSPWNESWEQKKGRTQTNNWTFLGWSFCPTAHSGWQHVLIIFHQNNVSWTKMIILLFHEWRVMEEMMVVNFSSVWKVSRNSHVHESIQDCVTHRCMKAYNWQAKHRQNLCVFINTLVVI